MGQVGGGQVGQTVPAHLQLVHDVEDGPEQVGEAVVFEEIRVLQQAEEQLPMLAQQPA